jgi:hypothetical protein
MEARVSDISTGISQILVMLVMPLPLLWKLNTSLRSKIAIIIMFSLGIFDLITSCIRLRSVILFGGSVNPSWDYTDILIWTGNELAVSIIVSSLPAIRVLLKHLEPRTDSWAATHNNNNLEDGSMFGDRMEIPVSLKAERSIPPSSGSNTFVGSQNSLTSRHTVYVAKRKSAQELLFANMSETSELHLGDKLRGDVRTEIGVGEKSDFSGDTGHQRYRNSSTPVSSSKSSRHASFRSAMESLEDVSRDIPEGSPCASGLSASPTSGILVQTITTTTVAKSPPREGFEVRHA